MSGNRVAGSPGCHAPQRVARPSLCPKHPGIAVVALPGCPWSVTIRRGAGKQKSLLQHGAPQTGFFYSYSRKCCKRWRVIRAEIAIRGEPVGLEIYEKLFSAVAAAMKPCRWGAALVIHSMRVQAVTPDGAGGCRPSRCAAAPLNPCKPRIGGATRGVVPVGLQPQPWAGVWELTPGRCPAKASQSARCRR